MAKAVLLSLKDHTLEKVPARMSAIQGPISYEPTIVRQATSPIQDIALLSNPTYTNQSAQYELGARISARWRGLAAEMDLLRTSATGQQWFHTFSNHV